MTFDDFRDPPPPPTRVFILQANLSDPSSESFRIKFSAIPAFGFSVTTDRPFCSPKNQVIPPKILRRPPPPQTINNDRSLTYFNLPYRRAMGAVICYWDDYLDVVGPTMDTIRYPLINKIILKIRLAFQLLAGQAI